MTIRDELLSKLKIKQFFKHNSLLYFMFFAILVMIVIFLTAHNRSSAEIESKVSPRYSSLMKFWAKNGFFANGGMWIWRNTQDKDKAGWCAPMGDEDDVKFAYKSFLPVALWPLFLFEKIHMEFAGHYSHRLMAIYNQVLIALGAVLLGMVTIKILEKIGIEYYYSILLGTNSLLVFQTFPIHIWTYWEMSLLTVPVICILLFCLSFFYTKKIKKLYQSIPMLLLCYISPSNFYIPLGYFFVMLVLLRRYRHCLKKDIVYVLLPSVLGVLLYLLSLTIVKVNYPDVEFIGSSFFFRTGFDGSIKYYTDHFALFGSCRQQYSFLYWPCLFWSGVVAVLLILFLYYMTSLKLKWGIIVLAYLVMTYVPYAFVFSQGVVIHSKYWDTLVVVPVIVSLFGILPAALEKISGQKGVFIFIFSLWAFCYSVVSIRSYVVEFPLREELQNKIFGYKLKK